jgi:hypothetical protein
MMSRPVGAAALAAASMLVAAVVTSDAAEPGASMPSPAVQQGQADRQAWEAWFNAQIGEFRAGAEYWAAHRSEPSPTCAVPARSVSPDWSAGCRAAAERLAAPDRRRKTERDYRAGWNDPVSTPAAAPAPRAPERISPGTSFRPGQTIVQEIVADREARGAPAPAREASGESAATLAWTVTILAAILGIVWLRARAKYSRRADQAGAFPAVPVSINLQSGEIGLFEAPASRSPFPDVTIDRAAIRSMVEDHWRSFISVAVSNPQIGFQSLQNFDERIQATAALMPPERAAMYLQAVEEEREILFNEYNHNPDALKRRLGLGPVRQPNRVVHQHRRQSIGELAVRTAVRATIWETVISLFRAFR